MNKLYLAMLALIFGLSLSACNTVDGVGDDVEDAGDAIEDVTDDMD